ncbi:homeobox protein H2.0 [Musca vetustissima]|uniref:homeobox protein H2.0 n=1 Tax=Musca vetustissima TaxID=27455 RepID=UPI002AB5EF49|nr:homeobox protein H2.0 [Musca vetustissima]
MAILDEEINFAQNKMEELPTNLSLDKSHNCDRSPSEGGPTNSSPSGGVEKSEQNQEKDLSNETRIHLSFSVDRLLNNNKTEQQQQQNSQPKSLTEADKCCADMQNGYSCCSLPNCLVGSNHPSLPFGGHHHGEEDSTMTTQPGNFMDFKSIVRPTPMRAMGGNNGPEQVPPMTSYSALTSAALIRLHHAHMQQKTMASHPHLPGQPNFALSSLLNPMCNIKPVSTNPHPIGLPNFPSTNSRYTTKGAISFDLPGMRPNLNCISNLRHHSMPSGEGHIHFPSTNVNSSAGSTAGSSGSISANSNNTQCFNIHYNNLQRKGLEIQFQQQKYITKPDRRKLAARLNLTDAQVKVWFQNRRMKWRHTRENLKSGQEKQPQAAGDNSSSAGKPPMETSLPPGYSSDCSSSLELSDPEEDDDEIDVVE